MKQRDVLVALALFRATASGTVCIELPADQALRHAAAVVEVEVSAIQVSSKGNRNQQAQVTVRVTRSWKGALDGSLELPVVMHSDMGYAYRFLVGERYVLYLRTNEDLLPPAAKNRPRYYLGTCPGRIAGPRPEDLSRERSLLSALVPR